DLPFELISKIFIHCLPRYGRVRPDPQLAPLLLLQICRRWRAVALATPWLWNSIFLECFRESGYTGLSVLFEDELPLAIHPIASLVDLWFSRCEGFPLSITLLSREVGLSLPYGVIGVLQSRCSWWNRLELRLTDQNLTDLFSVEGPFHLLQNVALGDSSYNVLPFEIQRDVYLKSPSLEILRMRHSSINPFFKGVMAGGPKLHTMELCHHRFDFDSLTEFFSLLPDLRHLNLEVYHPVGVVSSLRRLTIPGLKTLVVERNIDFLACISAPGPALEDLGVTVQTELEATIVVSFISFGTSFGNDILFPRNRMLPCLRNLSIVAHPSLAVYDELFRILNAHQTAWLTRVYIRILPNHHWGGDPNSVPAPTPEVLGLLRHFCTFRFAISLETPDFRWPADATNEVEPDFNIFQPDEPMPFSIW
ncbi:F-box domain-containing protein, partial [Favolaschia claudopus]